MVENQENNNEPVLLTEDEAKAFESMFDKAAKEMKSRDMIPWVFANDKNNPAPFGILNMFYAGVFTNTIGIMVAKDSETGDIVSVLVGLTKGEDGEPQVYPIARILGEPDTKRYLPPDGKGGYVEFPTEQ